MLLIRKPVSEYPCTCVLALIVSPKRSDEDRSESDESLLLSLVTFIHPCLQQCHIEQNRKEQQEEEEEKEEERKTETKTLLSVGFLNGKEKIIIFYFGRELILFL